MLFTRSSALQSTLSALVRRGRVRSGDALHKKQRAAIDA
jgi:hypothetical protein